MTYSEVKAYGALIKDGKGRIIVDFRFSDPTVDQQWSARRFAACWNKFLQYPTEIIESSNEILVPKSMIDTAIKTTQERDELLNAILEIAEQVRQCNYTMARSNALTLLQKYKKGEAE